MTTPEKVTLGLIGNGFVGGAASQLRCGLNTVLVYDLDPDKCHPKNITLEMVASLSDVVFIAVPTPSQQDGSCYIGTVTKIVQDLKQHNSEVNIVIRSTCPPGTADSLGVHFMPEFLTEKNADEDFRKCPCWVIGVSATESGDKTFRVMQQLFTNAKSCGKIESELTERMSPSGAEMVKYVRNCFLSVKVSFFNEVYNICQKLGLDYEHVRKIATNDTRIGGGHSMVPGPDGRFGYSGHCFPKDVFSFISFGYPGDSTDLTYSIVNASHIRNRQYDRTNHDWERDVGRAVCSEPISEGV